MINSDFNSSLEGTGLRSIRDLNKEDERSKLGQEDFLELMTTQLQNQDPFEPMENGDFLAQIAQFSTVSGIQDLQGSFESLSQSLVSNQALQAAGLVGRSVLAPTGIAALEQGGAVKGVVELPASSTDVNVTITDAGGQTIRTVELGGQAAGNAHFQWDGLTDNGSYANPGTYFISANADYDGSNTAVETLISSPVESVTLGNSGGLLLDLKGIGQLDFTEVRQIL